MKEDANPLQRERDKFGGFLWHWIGLSSVSSEEFGNCEEKAISMDVSWKNDKMKTSYEKIERSSSKYFVNFMH